MNDMTRVVAAADFFETAREFKFTTEGLPPGEFKGYGAVFGNVDSHGDIIEPGAFADSLDQRKTQGRGTPPMHVMHSMFGGDGLPIGKWLSVEEDAKGLRVHGKVSGAETETGKLHLARIADGAYGGLSIGYSVPKGGSEEAPKAGRADGAKRLLKKIDLHEISLVDEPSNAQAKFDQMKASAVRKQRKSADDPEDDGDDETEDDDPMSSAASSLADYMDLHNDCMMGGDSPSADERVAMLSHVQDAHEALTGSRTPKSGKKIIPTRRCEKALREIGFSHTQARDFAAAGLKQLHLPREEGRGQAKDQEGKAAADTARNTLSFLKR